MSKSNFDELLCESVEEGLSALGDSAKKVICYHLETTFNLRMQEIPNKTKDFSFAIKALLGQGADCFQVMILKQLYAKINKGFTLPSDEYLDFDCYVKQAAECYLLEA